MNTMPDDSARLRIPVPPVSRGHNKPDLYATGYIRGLYDATQMVKGVSVEAWEYLTEEARRMEKEGENA